MKIRTSNLSRGFTIVELLIVIVVIAILATITIVGYNGIQTRANNTARVAAGVEWVKTFQLYQALTGSLPTLPSTPDKICLGSGFPIGGGGVRRCQNVTGTDGNSPAESGNTALMTELTSKLGADALPSSKIIPALVTGPYLVVGTYSITIGLQGSYTIGDDCGGGFKVDWAGSGAATCRRAL